MKRWALVLLLALLSLLSGGRAEAGSVLSGRDAADAAERSLAKTLAGRDFCITAAGGYSFSGESSSPVVSVRNTNAGRRLPSQVRSSFRMIKAGKVVDNNRLHPFLTLSFVKRSGPETSERYLYSICRLRL